MDKVVFQAVLALLVRISLVLTSTEKDPELKKNLTYQYAAIILTGSVSAGCALYWFPCLSEVEAYAYFFFF